MSAYIGYCRTHGAEHDDSFLPDDTFAPTDEYPAYLLYDGDDVVGAVGLMCTETYRFRGKARFTMLHCVEPSVERYKALLDAVRPHVAGLSSVFGFLPEAQQSVGEQWLALGFDVERYAFRLANHSQTAEPAVFPEGYEVMRLQPSDTTGIGELCDLWNRSYGTQPGFIGATPDWIRASFDGDEHVSGGCLLLKHGDVPVGTARVAQDTDDNSAAVEMLSVDSAYRGKGLGRLMLRSAVEVALRHELAPVYLSVNAANASAVGLYLSEGFVKEKVMVCYALVPG